MGLLGDEIADVYISIHGDSSKFKRDIERLRATMANDFAQMGDEAADKFVRSFAKKLRAHKKGAVDRAARDLVGDRDFGAGDAERDARKAFLLLGGLKGARNDAV